VVVVASRRRPRGPAKSGVRTGLAPLDVSTRDPRSAKQASVRPQTITSSTSRIHASRRLDSGEARDLPARTGGPRCVALQLPCSRASRKPRVTPPCTATVAPCPGDVGGTGEEKGLSGEGAREEGDQDGTGGHVTHFAFSRARPDFEQGSLMTDDVFPHTYPSWFFLLSGDFIYTTTEKRSDIYEDLTDRRSRRSAIPVHDRASARLGRPLPPATPQIIVLSRPIRPKDLNDTRPTRNIQSRYYYTKSLCHSLINLQAGSEETPSGDEDRITRTKAHD
jgi:hypothetical protein